MAGRCPCRVTQLKKLRERRTAQAAPWNTAGKAD
jgi:hypothetical protein